MKTDRHVLTKTITGDIVLAVVVALVSATIAALLLARGSSAAASRPAAAPARPAAAPARAAAAGAPTAVAQGSSPTPAGAVSDAEYHAPAAAPFSHVAMPAPMPIGAPARAPIDPGDRADFMRAARVQRDATPTLTSPFAPPGRGGPAPAAPPRPTLAPTPFPLPLPPHVSKVRIEPVKAYSAKISWHTSAPTIGRVAYGIAGSFLWTPADGLATDHTAILDGLSFATSYVARVVSTDAYGQTVHSNEIRLTTLPMPAKTSGTHRDGTILVNDQPVFPIMAWAACKDRWSALLEHGLNTFMANGCGPDDEMVDALAGRAYTLVGLDNSGIDGRGVIGRYWPDEWDAFLPGDLTGDDLGRLVPAGRADRLDFLTMTSHVYSAAAPLEQGKGMYPALLAKADVLGFGIYPLQSWCAFDKLPAVSDAHRDLRAQTKKPTYQWIEVGPMEFECGRKPENAVTPETVNAETWLALAGGASGIGYFPAVWDTAIGSVIAANDRNIKELQPALLAPETAATSDNGVVVGARTRNGALYVIAVNPTKQPVHAQITVPGLGDRSASVYGENRSIAAAGDVVADDFAPLGVHVYIAAPAGV